MSSIGQAYFGRSLDRLVGHWSLTGKMGNTALYPESRSEMVLRELLLEVRFSPLRVGEDDNPDHEALYLIGFDKKSGEYVLHLFDTFGVTSKHVPGIGARKNNSIRFKFDYQVGPWFNTFTWDPQHGSWTNIITYEEKDGSEATFAMKELAPIQ